MPESGFKGLLADAIQVLEKGESPKEEAPDPDPKKDDADQPSPLPIPVVVVVLAVAAIANQADHAQQGQMVADGGL